jgi:toxin-antitoxin system PIN domain toxin
MIIPDVNVLLHAYDPASRHHRAMKAWWETTLSGARPVGLTWVVLLGFIRISTNPRIWPSPMRVSDATRRVRSWLEADCAEVIGPGSAHAQILFTLLETAGTAGNLTTDAHLAALATEYQAEIATTDADFARFPGVRHYNPAELRNAPSEPRA